MRNPQIRGRNLLRPEKLTAERLPLRMAQLEHISLFLNREDSQRLVNERVYGSDSFLGANHAETVFRRLSWPRD